MAVHRSVADFPNDAEGYTDDERARIEHTLSYSFVGAADDFGRRLLALARRYDAYELVLTTWTHGMTVRRRCSALIFDAMERLQHAR